ncbi:MAG TPA: hypothetical protein VK906_18455 [Egicoccus sp.]|nr:hypothetical protein [Egicoccus sp.]HSK25175.1 hypothetical protein [Egicoccus sp.]
MSDANPDAEDLQVIEHGDGWAVVRGDEVLTTHERRAGAEADRFRLADAGADDAAEADEVLTDEQGADPANEGG